MAGSGSIVRVDSGYYADIAGRLRGLLIRLSERLPDKDLVLIAEFIDANELGLPSNGWPTFSPRISRPFHRRSGRTCSPL